MRQLQNAYLKPCPHHGCVDTAIIKKDGYVFVNVLKCGARGSSYSLELLGEDMAVEMAIADWNKRFSLAINSTVD